MKKSFPLTFGRDINALNFPVDAREVADLDEDFAEMLALAKTSLSRPALIETSASHFQVLIPASLRHCPMWVVWLGKEFADELTSICHTEPVIWEKTSIDLQRRSSTLECPPRHNTCRLHRTKNPGAAMKDRSWHDTDKHSRTGRLLGCCRLKARRWSWWRVRLVWEQEHYSAGAMMFSPCPPEGGHGLRRRGCRP